MLHSYVRPDAAQAAKYIALYSMQFAADRSLSNVASLWVWDCGEGAGQPCHWVLNTLFLGATPIEAREASKLQLSAVFDICL